MTIHIELKPNEEQALLERARLSGRDPAQYAQQVIRDHIREGNTLSVGADEATAWDDLIDHEAIESCTREVEGKDIPSIEEVREALAKIPGSMARAVIEEREERC